MEKLKNRKFLAILCLLVILVPALVGFRPWAVSSYNFKTRHYGNYAYVTSTASTIDLSSIDAAFTAKGPKHLSLTNTSSTTDIYFNLESARAGQLATNTFNPGVLLQPGVTKDYDFTTSSIETRVATGAGIVLLSWEVVQ